MDILQRPQVIRAQLSYYLFVFRIYNQVRRIHATTTATTEAQSEHQADRARLKLAKFPHLWLVLKWYQSFTNFLYIYALLKYIHPDLLPRLLGHLLGSDQLLGLPLHCFLVGRFVAYPRLDRIVAILHAIANLSWRFTLQHANRPYRLDIVNFLSQREEHVRDYEAAYQAQRPRQQGNARREKHTSEWQSKFHLFHAFMSYEAMAELNSREIRRQAHEDAQPNRMLTMRPNRTLRSKQFLEHKISRMALCVSLALALLCVVSLPLMAIEIMPDSRYLRVYRKCDNQLEQLVRERYPGTPLDKLTSCTYTPIHLTLGVIDFIESASIWFESGLGITFVFMLPYILVQDLKCYWRLWNRRLNSLLYEARLAGSRRTGSGHPGCKSNHIQRHQHQQQQQLQATASKLSHQAQRQEFEVSVDELRQEICDFFNQFQQYELLMSDIISATFIFWFLGIFGFGYTIAWLYAGGSTILNLPLPLVVILFLAFFSFPLGLFSGCIFQLQADCGKSYQTLHSLLVFMRPEAKEKYLKILEFFSEQKRHHFRFLLGHRFTPTTMVSIVSWTSSWLALFMSIVK